MFTEVLYEIFNLTYKLIHIDNVKLMQSCANSIKRADLAKNMLKGSQTELLHNSLSLSKSVKK